MQAALLLPGIAATQASAADSNTLNLQVSRYEEDARALPGVNGSLPPLRADTLHLSGALLLRDSIRVAFGVTQDTWSGATPIAVAPLAANGNRPILRDGPNGVVSSGASPLVNGRIPLDGTQRPIGDARNVLVMSSASPELRKQLDLSVETPLPGLQRESALTLATSLSDEPDYRSRYLRAGGRFGFNANLTTLNLGAALTRSDTRALLDSDLLPYLTRDTYAAQLERRGNTDLLRGKRHDRTVDIGVTQVLDAVSLIDAGVTLTRATGFMENPYKAVTVIFAQPGNGDVRALMEQRPDTRRQLAFHTHYARHFAALDASLQLDYSQSHDDWGIDTHSMELGWAQNAGAWTVTPRLRYYTQSAADFHSPWLISQQDYRSRARDSEGNEIWTDGTRDYTRLPGFTFRDANGTLVDGSQLELQPRFVMYSPAVLPAHFSSDQRLAAFGSLSAGLTVQRRFERGVTLEAGLEYYTRADGLYAGDSANSSYADFDFTMANLALTVDLGAGARRQRREQAAMAAHAGHTDTMQHTSHSAPAGLSFAHANLARGAFMSGYRVMHMRQQGDLLRDADSASDADIVAQACLPTAPCSFAPTEMTMTMHMLDLMVGLTDRLTLMLMPQYATMRMKLRPLAGAPPALPGAHSHGGGAAHVSGAIGDTLVAGLFDLRSTATQALHASLGASIPTGKTDLAYRRSFQADGGLMDYGMQTGSGTWDLVPALTWSLANGAWQYGAQITGVKRLEDRNDQGYRLGDEVQVSGWTTRAFTPHISASLRAQWLQRGEIEGAFDAYNAGTSPVDIPGNYGGRFVDIGLGLNVDIAGSQLALEWLTPVHENLNGYQLERHGTLSASWQYSY